MGRPFFFFFFNPHPRIYTLISEREVVRVREEREREREMRDLCEKETSICCLPHPPQTGINPQPRYVPWPGMNLQPFGVHDEAPTNWANQPGLGRPFLKWKCKRKVFQTREQVSQISILEMNVFWCYKLVNTMWLQNVIINNISVSNKIIWLVLYSNFRITLKC